jgi:hypothetical protein
MDLNLSVPWIEGLVHFKGTGQGTNLAAGAQVDIGFKTHLSPRQYRQDCNVVVVF